MHFSVFSYYKALLIAPTGLLFLLIDLYNEGALQPNLRTALEIIEGLNVDD